VGTLIKREREERFKKKEKFEIFTVFLAAAFYSYLRLTHEVQYQMQGEKKT